VTPRTERIPGQEAARDALTAEIREALADPALTGDALERALVLVAEGHAAVMVDLCARPKVVVVDGRVRLEGAS
jgi:hypothetical protein